MQFTVRFKPSAPTGTAASRIAARFTGKVEITARRLDLPYDPAVLCAGPSERVRTEAVDFSFEVSEEHNTVNLDLRRFPTRDNLPMSVRSDDGLLVARLSLTIAFFSTHRIKE